MAAPKIEKLLTPYNFTNGSIDRIENIVLHYVGALGGAKANCEYYTSKYLGASAHYFVGFEGEIWQSVADENIAWHCGASSYKHDTCRNANSIGIELCVRNKGSQAADSKDWYFEDATVTAAVELTKYLMEKYNVNADHVLRHYDVTGKTCPNPYVYNTTAHTWEDFKKRIAPSSPAASTEGMTKITGKATATVEQMRSYIKAKNGSVAQSVLDMVPLYLSEGKTENIRGDIAFAQSCLETGNFTFSGSAVQLKQNNFCGLGVTQNGETGNSFKTPQLGIRAQIQHLKGYANTVNLKQDCVDPRFDFVSRGCAPYVEYLGIQENPKGKGWAAGACYGEKILKILGDIIGTPTVGQRIENKSQEQSAASPSTATAFTSYAIKTTCDVLNIRSGAGTEHKVVSSINEKDGQKKEYTIVEEKNGWGRLKSGAGWISLSYTKKASGGGNPTAFTSYAIKTTCDVLNIRSGAGTGYPVIGAIREKEGKKNQYTIVEEKDGWGRLKSGSGWISLSYTKKTS